MFSWRLVQNLRGPAHVANRRCFLANIGRGPFLPRVWIRVQCCGVPCARCCGVTTRRCRSHADILLCFAGAAARRRVLYHCPPTGAAQKTCCTECKLSRELGYLLSSLSKGLLQVRNLHPLRSMRVKACCCSAVAAIAATQQCPSQSWAGRHEPARPAHVAPKHRLELSLRAHADLFDRLVACSSNSPRPGTQCTSLCAASTRAQLSRISFCSCRLSCRTNTSCISC
jgi:hypothetical protein